MTRKVRAEVHRVIAELTAWSIEVAGNGSWPSVGFGGIPFKEGSQRFKKRGQELALGWRNLIQN